MIADVPEVAAKVAVLVPKSYQPKQLKVAASHKAHATPVDGSLVGYEVPAAMLVPPELVMVTAEVGATKLTQ